MKPSEIILQDSKRNGVDGEQVLRGIASKVKNNQAAILTSNNSVLTMVRLPNSPNSFSLHLFSMDTPLTLAKSLAVFIKTIRAIPGAQSVYGTTKNQQLLNLLRKLKVDVLESDLAGFTWMAKI